MVKIKEGGTIKELHEIDLAKEIENIAEELGKGCRMRFHKDTTTENYELRIYEFYDQNDENRAHKYISFLQ